MILETCIYVGLFSCVTCALVLEHYQGCLSCVEM